MTQKFMIRLLILILLVGRSGAGLAQVADTSARVSPTTSGSMSSVAAETRARDEAFAAWKVRYATNRASVAREVKAVQRELANIPPAKAELKQQLTNLLNGTVRRWNEEKTDYADPDQFAGCQALFATIRQALREGVLKLQ